MKRILWLSRHEPLPAQINELKRIFGENTIIDKDPEPFSDVNDIMERLRGYDDVVVVAPLSMIAELTKRGVKPLWAEMQVTKEYNPETGTIANNRFYKFVEFKRISDVKIIFEEVEKNE